MGNFSILPSEITLDIFTRLPAEEVLECKSVSKAWKNVVEHPCFSKLHFNHLNDLDSGLKRRSCHDDPVDFFVIGFGYVHSSNEYKVVRLYKFMREPKFARIEVYTLGSGKGWRDEGKKIEIGLGGWQHGVFANGCIYWNFGNGKIVAFDLADEMFVELSECPIFRCRRIRLGVLGDHLCATNSDTITNISDVWLLKKHKDESLMSWSKEFSITNMDGYDTPLTLMDSAKLLCHSNTNLYLYDLKSSSSKLLANFGRHFHQAIPHRNTLISINSITREKSKSLESGEKVQ